VKAGVSSGELVVRGFPVSQVKSAKANGAGLSALSGAGATAPGVAPALLSGAGCARDATGIVTTSAQTSRRSARVRGRQNSETYMSPPMCTPRARSPGVQHDPCRGESHRVLVSFPRSKAVDELARTKLDTQRRHVSQQHLTHKARSGL